MEQKPRARYDEFAEQFTCVLHEHWSDILQQPRDNEIVAQAIRTWARAAAQLNLPRVTVDFEL